MVIIGRMQEICDCIECAYFNIPLFMIVLIHAGKAACIPFSPVGVFAPPIKVTVDGGDFIMNLGSTILSGMFVFR